MITVKVPATSANVGSGFDALGLAVTLYNTVTFEEWDHLEIRAADESDIPTEESNLVYQSVKAVYDRFGKTVPGLRIVQTNPIPMARGLGSSSACIVAGLLGANYLLGNPMDQHEVLTLATQIEGHPDNVAPALLGGLTSCVLDDDGTVYGIARPVDDNLVFAAFVPDYPLLTEDARRALPATVTHKEAVYNLSRAALVRAAFCDRCYELLRVCTKDSLQQKYRLPLMPGGDQIFALSLANGADAVYISGAGSTIMAVVKKEKADAFFARMESALPADPKTKAFSLMRLTADNTGATVY